MNVRIGSLCSGYGGLDLAVMDALPGAEVAWHAQYDPDDKHQYAARILAHRWPCIPNFGDITAADWFEAEPVDILTAGYPCQPISYAGKGLVTEDARWIWPAVAQSIRLLRPGLVFLENVAAHVVRGLGDVIADLAKLGYVGSWLCLRASDVGAPHQRKRLFILARPADADTADLGHQWSRQPRDRRTGPADGCFATANAGCYPRSRDNAHRPAAGGRGQTAADADGGRRRDGSGIVGGQRPKEHLTGDRPTVVWGAFAEAVRRWEFILGCPAPAPVDERGRLAPPFVEWMMGAPAGWVTDVPGIPRNAQLKALGNGVVRQQGTEAFRILSRRLAASP